LFETYYGSGNCPFGLPEIDGETAMTVFGNTGPKNLTVYGAPYLEAINGDCFPDPYNFQTSSNTVVARFIQLGMVCSRDMRTTAKPHFRM
jgi:hypothetical protein